MDGWLAALQAMLILGFSMILTATRPELWLHPLGLLTKNLPLLAILVVLWRLDHRGWDALGEWALRVGMAVIWLTGGLAALFLYGLPLSELARAGVFVPLDAANGLRLLGILSAASGVAALACAAGRGASCCWSSSRS